MKSNPLFVDSTRFKGETIFADLEVYGVKLHLTEQLYSRITLSDNRSYFKQLMLINNKYTCSVRLSYRQSAWIKHVIMSGGYKIEESSEQRFYVNYSNQFTWDRQIKSIELVL